MNGDFFRGLMPDGVTKFLNTDPLTWFILGPSLFFAVFGTVQLLLFFSFSFFIFYNEPYFDIADFGAIYYEFKLEKLT